MNEVPGNFRCLNAYEAIALTRIARPTYTANQLLYIASEKIAEAAKRGETSIPDPWKDLPHLPHTVAHEAAVSLIALGFRIQGRISWPEPPGSTPYNPRNG